MATQTWKYKNEGLASQTWPQRFRTQSDLVEQELRPLVVKKSEKKLWKGNRC